MGFETVNFSGTFNWSTADSALIDWTVEDDWDFLVDGTTYVTTGGVTITAVGTANATQLEIQNGVGLIIQCNGGGTLTGNVNTLPHVWGTVQDLFDDTIVERDFVAIQHHIVHSIVGTTGYMASFTGYGQDAYTNDYVYIAAGEAAGPIHAVRRTIGGIDSSPSNDATAFDPDSISQVVILGVLGRVDAHYADWDVGFLAPNSPDFTTVATGTLGDSDWPHTPVYDPPTDRWYVAQGCGGDYSASSITIKKSRFLVARVGQPEHLG